ncbi:MAG: hypothetical protein ACRDGA_03940, partial [Bacteroidota bacterium]
MTRQSVFLSAMSPALLGLLVVAQLTLLSSRASAGPPLICHPIMIGNAKSLPSGDGPFGTKRDYDRTRLVEETLALLTGEMPVLVRMETLRRASLYASGIYRGKSGWSNYSEEDRRIAYELLARLMSRTLEAGGSDRSTSMRWFDVGYLMACYEQTGLGKEFPGYSFVKKALSFIGEDPEIEFACAIVTVWPKRYEHSQH